MYRERSLDANAEADLANRERFVHTSALTLDDNTFEHLDAFLVALDYASVDLDRVTRAEVGDVVAKACLVDEVGGLHNKLQEKQTGDTRYYSRSSYRPDPTFSLNEPN